MEQLTQKGRTASKEKLQVLVATVNQKDLSLGEKMNIRCPAIFANQCDRETTELRQMPFGEHKMICTKTRGVGRNRNIALQAADAEILLFADDDIVYCQDMPRQVLRAFEENPKAQGIIFSIDYEKNGEIIERRHLPLKRLRKHNAMRFGACAMAVRRQAISERNISFHLHFGGGCMYGSGEDSLFISDCLRKGLKLYSHPYVLGLCSKDSSTWFSGYHEKFFYDKGALMGYLFPYSSWIMTLYFAVRFKRKTPVPMYKRIALMYRGLHGGKNLKPYEDTDR